MTAPAAGLPETRRPAADLDGPGLLAAALACARRGWHVFPLRPGSKQPALHGQDRCPRTGVCQAAHQGWEQRATTDPDRIHACWTHSPRCNPAIACGPSGLVVIDLDTPEGAAAPLAGRAGPGICDGARMLAWLCDRHGRPWPIATFTVATPSGTHLYFTTLPGARLRNTAGRLGWCIDTRAAGGYVVAPGSVIAGRSYAVVSSVPPAPLPGWLAMRLAEPVMSSAGAPLPVRGIADAARYGQAVLDRQTRRVAEARRGQRNDTLNRAAFALGQLTAVGLLPASLAYAKLVEAAVHAGLDRDPGCGRRGIDRTIRSGLTAGAQNPRSAA